jgi:pilus assembly protein CpaF
MHATSTGQSILVDVVIQPKDGEPRRQRIGNAQRLTVGRHAQSAVVIEGEGVSRQHAVVTLLPTALRVEDTSSNWTIAGKTVLRRESAEVPYGTPIVIGTFTLHVMIAVPEPPPPRTQPTPVRVASHPAPSVIVNDDSPHVAGQPPATVPPPAPATKPPEVRSGKPTVPATTQKAISTAAATAPTLTDVDPHEAEVQLRREIHRMLLENLDLATMDAAKLDDPSMRPRVLTALRRIVKNLDARIPKDVERDTLVGELADEALGLGPLERFLADNSISEVMVVDPQTIYVEKNGKLVKSDARFTDDERVRAVIERIVTPLGRRIDESSPLVDARLKDGSRVNAIIRPLALRGSCITIRKFSATPLTIEKLIGFGTLTEAMARFLARSVIAKKNVVISGGTGSGKTTLLNILSAAIPSEERIVTIEDAAELQLKQPHVVSLETRPANMEGRGEYTIRDLVKNALRMRPDRIVVGECRGGEALDMLQAMNTGHDGSLTTTHANSPREAIARLETLVLMGGLDLPSRAIRDQIANSIHLVVQVSRMNDGTRKLTAVTEVVGIGDEGEIELRPVFEFVRTGTGQEGKVEGQFRATGYLPSFLQEFIVRGLVKNGEPYL